jgi:hypothetical protein
MIGTSIWDIDLGHRFGTSFWHIVLAHRFDTSFRDPLRTAFTYMAADLAGDEAISFDNALRNPRTTASNLESGEG